MRTTVEIANPIITSYPPYANQLALTDVYLNGPYCDDYLNWFVLQYLNIMLFLEEHYNGMILFDDVFHTNMIHASINSEVLWGETYNGVQMQASGIDFLSFLLERLENGYAITLYLNHRFFHNAACDENKNHEVFVTGYDEQTRSFDVYDFYSGKRYGKIAVSRDEMLLSFSTFTQLNTPDSGQDYSTNILTYRRLERLNVAFDPQAVCFLLERWAKGETRGGRAYGRRCYHYLQEWTQTEIGKVDIRSLHLLFDHKAAIQRVVDHYMDKGVCPENPSIREETALLRTSALIARNIRMKYEHCAPGHDDRDQKDKRDIRMRLQQMEQSEERIFSFLYDALCKV